MKNAILIETPFASATQTAKILGVSKSRKRQLVNMLKIARAGFKDRFALPAIESKKNGSLTQKRFAVFKAARKSRNANVKRRLSSKKHASKKTRSTKSGNSSH